MAFEQGKILPTPETVPFRLSRDIVDGMGITGVEGVFRRQVVPALSSCVLPVSVPHYYLSYTSSFCIGEI